MIKGLVQKLLVAVNDGIKFFRYSENHMKVWGVQYILPAGIHPFFPRELLTHRTTPVPAGIIMDGNTAAVLADAYIDTKCAGFAVHDVINCFLLCRRQFMGFLIVRIKAVKHILYRAVFAHDPPPSKTSKGLRIPSSVLLLTCRYTSVERGSTWPRSDWIYLISTPFSNK